MKTGTRLRSQVCGGEVIVVRVTGTDVPPDAGGQPMLMAAADAVAAPTGAVGGDGFPLGKRYEYVDDDSGVRLELLVTKTGTSTLTWGGIPLAIKGSKPLPSSD